ncbi:MAG TPA: molybdate ABC transporter substrate-binding protein [Dehalococcoidia bacterium]|nr:molybdate ABC transporter substrate-binding protein [Dehalococcoidia bacterium]
MRRFAVAALASLLALAAACGGERPEITVAAASDLRGALEEVAAAYQRGCECRVQFSFGSSGNLATQIRGGLPVDAFFSADEGFVDGLIADGLLLPDSRTVYARGRLALAVPAGSDLKPRSLDDLRDSRVRRIAIANPEHAPYGAAARQALAAAGVWDEVEPKLVLGENASQATQFVETGNAQAGILPLSLAIQNQRLRFVDIDESLYEPLRQAAAVLKRSGHPELARAFIEFVAGPQGRKIMEQYGFLPPREEAS